MLVLEEDLEGAYKEDNWLSFGTLVINNPSRPEAVGL